jgi:hypothetical protein
VTRSRTHEAPVWDACEDCMGSGRIPAMFGGGECHCYNGRMPANDAADQVVRRNEQDRRARLQRMLRFEDEYDRDFGDY